jgi:2-phospho-L-lactate/phosphoenolpyruvate guanylyltransferase
VATVRLAVLVPVKRFSAAKGRLTGVLGDSDRARLAEWMASGVLDVVAEIPTFVACDDEQVAAWASRMGAQVIWGAGLGLNGAVDDGVDHIISSGFHHVLVSHADLALPAALLDVPRDGCITLVPDRRHDGTNVMSFPAAHRLHASYGGGSFARHLDEALAMATVPVEVRSDPQLSLDLDTPRDLTHPLITKVLPSWLPTNPANPVP